MEEEEEKKRKGDAKTCTIFKCCHVLLNCGADEMTVSTRINLFYTPCYLVSSILTNHSFIIFMFGQECGPITM